MAYLDIGQGPPLVCVHGSLCDFRIWSAVLGPLTQKHRVIAVSLRHFFPERWDGVGDTYSIAQHVDDVIAFIGKLDAGPVDLMGHSRGGHVSFRVAQRRPDLLRKLILAEPGGELDATLDPAAKPGPSPLAARIAAAADKIGTDDVEGGLTLFFDAIEGPRRLGAPARVAEAAIARQRVYPARPGPRSAAAVLQGRCGGDQGADAVHRRRQHQGNAAACAAHARRACGGFEDGDDPQHHASDVRAGAAKI
jgi:pimeloyl-ACP methyl ester carboxylesterase